MKSGELADSIRTARHERCRFLLRNLGGVAKHLTRTREVKATPRTHLAQRRQHIVRAVDVHVHSREAVGETFRDETLRCEVVALVKFVLTQNVEDTRITLQTRWMQRDAIDQMSNPAESHFRHFQCHAAHEPVHFIAETQQIVSQIATVLTGNASNQCSLGYERDLTTEFRSALIRSALLFSVSLCLCG